MNKRAWVLLLLAVFAALAGGFLITRPSEYESFQRVLNEEATALSLRGGFSQHLQDRSVITERSRLERLLAEFGIRYNSHVKKINTDAFAYSNNVHTVSVVVSHEHECLHHVWITSSSWVHLESAPNAAEELRTRLAKRLPKLKHRMIVWQGTK